MSTRRPSSVIAAVTGGFNRRMSFMKFDNLGLTKSLDYWSRHNPLLMADEVFLESRGAWESKNDFIISCLSYGIGLGNMWRFPYICLKSGCGSFLAVYTLFVIIIAIPLSLLETSLAQFTSTGVTQCWQFSPGFKGIGFSMLLMSLFCSFCYVLVLSWSFFYSLNSLRINIPFLNCHNFWNDYNCIPLLGKTNAINDTRKETSAEQFWYRYVTTQFSLNGQDINDINQSPEKLIWYTAACLVITWCITAVILMKGVKVSRQKIFISIFFPYTIVLVFIILCASLPGSKEGVLLFLTPRLETLSRPSTWLAAGEQIFFSFGVGFGGIITMGSYNRFHYNIQRDTIIICIANYLTAFIGGITSFSIIGYISQKYSKSLEDIIEDSDIGLIFIIYPESCAYFSYPQLTNTLYFITLFILGFDSILIMMETVVTGLIDIVPVLNETQYHRICFVFVLHLGCMIFSMIFVTKTGYNWFIIFIKYVTWINVMIVGLLETIIVVFFYRLKNFYRDCKMMVPNSLSFIWKICFMVLIPPILSVLLAFNYMKPNHIYIGKSNFTSIFPIWAEGIGWALLTLTFIPIPGFFFCYLLYNKLSKYLTWSDAFLHAITPDLKWGPMKKRKWLLDEYYSDRLLTIKKNAETLKLIPRGSTSVAKTQWYQRLNLLSDTRADLTSTDDSHTRSNNSDDELAIVPFEINYDVT